MHIQRQTPMELVLQDGSMWMAFIFVPSAIFVTISSIEKHQPRGFFAAALCLLFAAVFTRHTSFSFDKMQRVARWSRRTFFKVETGSLPFDSIRDIVIDAQAGDRNTATYRLSLVTADGPLPMANMFQGGSIGHYQGLRQQILEFLGIAPAGSGVPAPEPGILSDGIPSDIEPSLRAMLAQGRTIDAIALLRTRENIGLADAKSRIDGLLQAMQSQAGSATELGH